MDLTSTQTIPASTLARGAAFRTNGKEYMIDFFRFTRQTDLDVVRIFTTDGPAFVRRVDMDA